MPSKICTPLYLHVCPQADSRYCAKYTGKGKTIIKHVVNGTYVLPGGTDNLCGQRALVLGLLHNLGLELG